MPVQECIKWPESKHFQVWYHILQKPANQFFSNNEMLQPTATEENVRHHSHYQVLKRKGMTCIKGPKRGAAIQICAKTMGSGHPMIYDGDVKTDRYGTFINRRFVLSNIHLNCRG